MCAVSRLSCTSVHPEELTARDDHSLQCQSLLVLHLAGVCAVPSKFGCDLVLIVNVGRRLSIYCGHDDEL